MEDKLEFLPFTPTDYQIEAQRNTRIILSIMNHIRENEGIWTGDQKRVASLYLKMMIATLPQRSIPTDKIKVDDDNE